MKTHQSVFILLSTVRLCAQTITTEPTNQVVAFGGNATFTTAVSGVGPFTYQWQLNGTNLPDGIITTVVGDGETNFSGDNTPAAAAALNFPASIALDARGNLFIADSGNYRVRKVDTNGIISTVAGNGTSDFSGDAGQATNAGLTAYGIALDNAGDIFISDIANSRIREVQTNGVIGTIAGNGDGLDFTWSSNGGPATNASLNPYGMTLDCAGYLFVANSYNEIINKIDTNGIITTVAGGLNYFTNSYSSDNGVAGTNALLPYPSDVAIDRVGDLFIAGNFNNRVYKLDTNGTIFIYAGNGIQGYSGDGLATNVEMNSPFGVAVDNSGNVFIAERFNNIVRRVGTNGMITTVAGDGAPGFYGDGGDSTLAELNDPESVAVDRAGNLFIADTDNQRIRKVANFGSLPALVLNNITTNDAGEYSVIITGSQGSVTSSIATLTVTLPPSITVQPQAIAVTNGCPATFAVSAVGLPSLAYQWLFDGANLFGATNATLALHNTFTFDAGFYQVVLTNAFGAVTSNPATLTVLPLGMTAIKAAADQKFQLTFDTVDGADYEVECSTNLTHWLPLITVGGTGTPLTIIDPNSVVCPQLFYRLEVSPPQ